jgi:acetyl-CoA acetyltransferase
MVHPVAYAEITNFDPANGTPDITETGFSVVGPEVFAKAGLSVDDIDMFQPYDDFLIAVMLQLEQIGFCKRGEGGAYLNATDISPGGKLPVNTGGGQISAGQPGLGGGGVNLTEGVRQLFGEAGARQVPNARNALVTGIGVIPYARNWGSSTCMILEKA